MGSIYLETERVRLREFDADDEDHLFELDSDPEVMRFLTEGVPSTREHVQGGLGRIEALRVKHGGRFGFWAAIERSSGAFMGWFHFRPSRSTPDDTSRIELGYRLKATFWGRGLATEVSKALVEKGFRDLGVETIFAIAAKGNLRSRRVMEKCGLSYVRDFVEHDLPPSLRDAVEYATSRNERGSRHG
ncbi:MAG: GNAT family N-acetyltransferase [Polyangiaceae bacterium]